MPLKYAKNKAASVETEDAGLIEKYGPTAIRGVAGIAGFTPVTGALFGGGGEILAQMLEKGTLDPRELDYRRIGSEAVVGGTMGKYSKALGSLVKGSKAGLAALKGGAYGASAPVLRHGIEEGDFNPLNYPGEVLTSGAVSAATGGAVAKLFGGKATPNAGKPSGTPTYRGRSGLRVALDDLKKGSKTDVAVTPDVLAKHEALAAEQVRNPKGPIASEIGPPVTKPSIVDMEKLHAEAVEGVEKGLTKEGTQLTKNEKLRDKFIKENLIQDTRNEKAAAKFTTVEAVQEARNIKARDKFLQAKADEDAAKARIEELLEVAKPGPPTVTETATLKVPGGRQTLRQTFGKPSPNTPVPLPEPQPSKTVSHTTFPTKEAALEAATSAGGKWRISKRGKGNWKATPLDGPTEPLPSLGPAGPAAQKFQSKIDELLSKVEGAQAAKASRVVPETPAAMPMAEPPPVRPPEGPTMPPEPPSPPPVAPTPKPKKGGPKGSGGAAAAIGKGTSGLDPKIEREVSRIAEEMETFGFTPRMAVEQLGKGSTMEWMAGSGGAPVYDDIIDISGYTLDNTTRSEVTSAIRKVLAGGKPRGNKQLKLMRAAVTVGEARLKDPRSVSKPWLPPAKAAADDMMSLEDFSKAIDEAAKQPIAEAPFSLGREAAKTTPVASELPGMATSGQAQSAKARAAALAARKAKTTEAAPLPEAWQKLTEGPAPALASVAEGGAIPARLYKSAKEAAGEGYGAIKAARAAGEAVPEAGRAAAGRAAQRLSKAAQPRGLPTAIEDALRAKGVPEENITKLRELSEKPPPTPEELAKDVKEWVKSKSRGTTLSAFGAGQLDDVVDIARENPEFLAKLIGTIGGAATGAAINQDDPLEGAIVGGGLGFAGGAAASKLPRMLGKDRDLKDITDPIISRVPNWTRGSLLSHPYSIAWNSIAGPWGSNFFGGLEQTLKGLVNADTAQREAGQAALKGAVNAPKWLQGFWASLDDAAQRIDDVEDLGRAGKFVTPDNPNIIDRLMKLPATWMLGGDLNTRNILGEAGIPEALARRITLTSEPRRAMWKNIANWGKAKSGETDEGEMSTLAQLMMPFKRTAANIMESGTERTPILGTAINLFGDKSLRIPYREQLLQEGIGGVVFGLGYAAGSMTPEELNKSAKIHSLVSNLGGQYSLLANAGFTAGQAIRRGEAKLPGTAKALISSYVGFQGLPLPSTDPIMDIVNPYTKAISGEYGSVKDFAKDVVPDAMIPKVIPFIAEGFKGSSSRKLPRHNRQERPISQGLSNRLPRRQRD